MFRTDSEYVRERTRKHIRGHMSEKELKRIYEVNRKENPNKKPLNTLKTIWKEYISEYEITIEEMRRFVQSLRLNSRKTNYSDKEVYELYVFLLAKHCSSFVK